jgi:hypothetical protein
MGYPVAASDVFYGIREHAPVPTCQNADSASQNAVRLQQAQVRRYADPRDRPGCMVSYSIHNSVALCPYLYLIVSRAPKMQLVDQ